MAVRVIRPDDWLQSDFVEVESDAVTNPDAVADIEEWADQNGFLRTREHWLQHVLSNGRRVYRSVCYRPSRDETDAVEASIRARSEAVRRQATG